jgi:hypothetical protein
MVAINTRVVGCSHDAPSCLDTVAAEHLDIHQDHVGRELGREVDGVVTTVIAGEAATVGAGVSQALVLRLLLLAESGAWGRFGRV